jgi:hypothetical protein
MLDGAAAAPVAERKHLGSLDVVALRGRRDRSRFLDLPYRLHRRDPSWVPPLRQDVRRLLSRRRNPFFDHGDACFWLAWRNGVPVGRISAQVNRLHLDTHRDETGHFGMLEAIDDPEVFAALMAAAELWLRDRGMRRILGPYSLTMNDDIGLLLSGFESPPMVGLPYTPPYYAERLAALGYAKAKDVLALRLRLSEVSDEQVLRLERLTSRLREEGRLGVRFFDLRHFQAEMRLALDIYNAAWAQNWGFIPVSQREANQIIKQLAPVMPAKGAVFALADGEPAAMLVALPDLNEFTVDLDGRLFPFNWLRMLWRLRFAKTTGARALLTGISPRYRGSALSTALLMLMIEQILKSGREAGIEVVEFSWILEDNRPSLDGCQALGARLDKVYRIFAKAL